MVCATGNKSLKGNVFSQLENGCVIASVTSKDDEFDMSYVEENYTPSNANDSLSLYANKHNTHSFMMIGNGNAANFLHGAVIGPAMQLIEGEKLAAIKSLIEHYRCSKSPEHEFVNLTSNGIYELHETSRRIIAEIWNRHFLE